MDQCPVDELEQEIQEINEEIVNCRKRGDHLSVKSLLLARRDLRLAKSKEVSEGDTLEARFSRFCDDSELQIYALDQMTQGGRGWNKNNSCWWNKQFAEQAATHIRNQVADKNQRR